MNTEKSLCMKHTSVQRMPVQWYFASFFALFICRFLQEVVHLLILINFTNSCGFLGLNSAISAGQYTDFTSPHSPLNTS